MWKYAKKEEIYIFGHRNPDTDSVTAAITLSYLKNKLGLNTIPVVLSSLNLESKYALNYFNVPEPMFLNDVNIKVKDLKYTKNYTINENESIFTSYYKMQKAGISKIPVVDSKKQMLGIIGMKDIAKAQFEGNFNLVDAFYSNILDALKGKEILRYNEEIKGNLLVAGYRSTTFIEEITLNNSDILIVGDRHSIIEYAIKNGVKLIVVTGGREIKKEHIDLARANNVNIISTDYSTLETTKLFNLCNNVTTILNDRKVLCIDENEDLNNFIKILPRTAPSNFTVPSGINPKSLTLYLYILLSIYSYTSSKSCLKGVFLK